MAKQPEVAAELPPLPATSIDHDALQAALLAGKSGEEAVAAAVAVAAAPAANEPVSEAPTEPDEPAGDEPA